MDDKNIIELYLARNETAIAETAKKYGTYCYSIAHGILYCHEDATECVNDTYNSAWNCIPPHIPTVLSAFLGKITRRISIDRYRKNTATRRGGGEIPVVLDELLDCVSDKKSIESELDKKQLTNIINTFVASLSQSERTVFIRRYWYIESISDIGNALGYSQSKVKSMLFRTREKLRIELTKEGFI